MNPFEPPSADKPSSEKLGPVDMPEQLGDRYFWQGVALIGVVIAVTPWLFGWHSFLSILFGGAITVEALRGWARERREERERWKG